MKNRIILFISLIFLLGIFYFSLPNKLGKVVFCDVGQGDAILTTYKNIQILIDTGPDNKKVLACLNRHLPFWDKTIEVMILTHGDSDHIGGLEDVLKSYKVKNIFSNEQNISSKKVSQNDVISTNMFDFEVVNPTKNIETDDDNINSVAGYLMYKGNVKWTAFLSADIDKETEQRLVWQKILNKQTDVLKVAHHGSENGTSNEILDFLKPKIGVISVGKNNRFDHPRKEVLERLKSRNIEIKRTDEIGDIVFEMN